MKSTSVLVQLNAPLRNLPPNVIGALEMVLFTWIRGMDERHDARWRRLWKRLFHATEARPSLQAWIDVERSRPFHARWMAIEKELFSQQDGFYSLGGFREWLKTGAAFGHYEASAGALVFVPSSLNWEDCSDDEMREFTQDALTFLRTAAALATLWPLVRENQRGEMLEAALTTNEETTQ